ncbi:DUF2442 domain-containing protein [Xylophilus rhododendri]|uniref:DUF2442 domain-containing protein n=1 Tax=Xylophilus rhododendri TaxID=2697032 RepID=A0A857J230_9BURK|nr:DUF2442 domain-containing protein [Xylophilus rhododendri]QHI97974.1 DUF2442 domain-containing protein [Xylophilus rhododendri]
MTFSKKQIANAHQAARLAGVVTVMAAHHDCSAGRIVIELSNGVEIAFRPHDVRGLEAARLEDLDEIEISPSGLGLHFPAIDADLYLPALLRDFFGAH